MEILDTFFGDLKLFKRYFSMKKIEKKKKILKKIQKIKKKSAVNPVKSMVCVDLKIFEKSFKKVLTFSFS